MQGWQACGVATLISLAIGLDCRVPLTYLRETKKFVVPELPEAPLIVFINSRSGGRAGPKLAETLFHALGHSQVT